MYEIAQLKLEVPLMNAAGTCKMLEGDHNVYDLAYSDTAVITIGSITLNARGGNSGNVYWFEKGSSLNSLGLPNPGARYYKTHLPEMVSIAHGVGKKLIVSVAGFSPEEYIELSVLVFEGGADMVELNLGCPNIWGNSGQKPIACFDVNLTGEILHLVQAEVGEDAMVSVKVSPYSNPLDIVRIAEMVKSFGMVNAIVTMNTFPNAIALDEELTSVISTGLAGLAGPSVKPIALGQVIQWRNALLDSDIQIIGVGGIANGQDVVEFLESGATVVQIATTYLERGEIAFAEILAEYYDLVEE